ncbi:MAG TPA: sugar phosphate isomerase/epimerase [Caldilineae bacterium]|nr:sugar phosphate isomerase/epimerase [Caldilineae bacterium]
MKLMMFSKHLQTMSVAEAGRVIRDLGFEGVDLTVRPGGHVLPENVRTELPAAVRTLADLGLQVPLITTAITAADEPYAVDIFETAAEAGVPEIKLGYWRYEGFGTFRRAMDEVARRLDGIEKLAQRTGVRANIHTHSGDYMSASPFIIWHWIKDRDPAAIGAYVDAGHIVVEGGVSTWKMAIDLLRGRITLLAVKDMEWQQVDDPTLGKKRWITKMVPLNRGVVPWPEVFACLREVGFDGWISVHSEYQGSHSWRDLTVEELIEQTRGDLVYLRWAMRGE